MFSDNSKISARQLSRMLVFYMFSLSGLIIPSIAVRSAGRDGVISLITGTILALFYAYALIGFSKKVRGDYIDFSKETVGKVITLFFSILYFFKLFISCIFAIGLFGQIISETLLIDTNYKVVILLLIIVAVYASSKGIEVQARIVEIQYFIVLVPIFIILLIGIRNVDIQNMFPLFTSNPNSIIKGSYFILVAYSALEVMIFSLPMMNKEKKVIGQLQKSIFSVGILNLLIFVNTVGMIGTYATQQRLWSAVTTMQMIEMPGRFIQRQDGVMLALWIISAFAIIGNLLFYMSFLAKKIIKVKDYRIYMMPIAIVIYFVTTKSMDMELIFKMYGKYMIYIGFPQSIIIPGIIVLIDAIKNKKQKE